MLQNLSIMTFFVNRVFANVITFIWGHNGLEWAPVQWLVSFSEKQIFDTYAVKTGMWWRNTKDWLEEAWHVIPCSFWRKGCGANSLILDF